MKPENNFQGLALYYMYMCAYFILALPTTTTPLTPTTQPSLGNAPNPDSQIRSSNIRCHSRRCDFCYYSISCSGRGSDPHILVHVSHIIASIENLIVIFHISFTHRRRRSTVSYKQAAAPSAKQRPPHPCCL